MADRRVPAVSVSPSHPGRRFRGLRRDRAEQPVSVRGRGNDLAAAARAAASAQRATLVVPAAAVDPPREHDRPAPVRPGVPARRHRTRRRDAFVGRRPHLGRPQPAGAQRRPPAPHPSARARSGVRGRGTGNRAFAGSRPQLAPDRLRPRPTLRVGGRGRSGRPGPLVRLGEPLPVRRARRR